MQTYRTNRTNGTTSALFLGTLFVLFVLLVPSLTYAAEATHQQILDALQEGIRKAGCTEVTSKTGSDCTKTTSVCLASAWLEHVEESYEPAGPSVIAKKGNAGPYEALEYLRADWERNKAKPPGPVQRGSCYCRCEPTDLDVACQGKDPGFPVLRGERLTYEQCVNECSPRAVATDKCRVAPVTTVGSGSTIGGPSDQLAFCFNASECAAAQGFYEAGEGGCGAGRGKCFAAEPEITLNQPFGDVKVVRGFNQYLVAGYQFMISIVAIAATVMFTWGAFVYLLGSANILSIARGKEIMIDAVVGLILVLASTAILRTINPATTTLSPIKVYLVNTIQFTNTAFCKDLRPNARLAAAGVRPALQPYDMVAKNPNAFSFAPEKTKCGESYWIKDAIGSACEGSACNGFGEACVSCADPSIAECAGMKATDRVCQKTIFSGTVTFTHQRYPEEVALILACNNFQNNNASIVKSNAQFLTVDAKRVGLAAGGQETDKDETGQATYRFNLTAKQVQDAVAFCGSRGGLRGALLGVQYNDDGVDPTYRALAAAAINVGGAVLGGVGGAVVGGVAGGAIVSGYPYDDFAILSKANCGTAGAFDGYDTGSSGLSDNTDLSEGLACAFPRGKLLNGNGIYWTLGELQDAVSGVKPITCDFSLTSNNAPSDPGRICTP